MSTPPTPFHDLRDFVAITRLTGLVLAPDGDRLVASLQQLAPDGARYQTSLWEIDPTGVAAPRRLTHSEPGESEPAFVGDGTLLFTSKRPGPDGETSEESALWRLPRQGEADRVAVSPGGLSQPVGAQAASGYVVATSRLPGADEAADEQWRRDHKGSQGQRDLA